MSAHHRVSLAWPIGSVPIHFMRSYQITRQISTSHLRREKFSNPNFITQVNQRRYEIVSLNIEWCLSLKYHMGFLIEISHRVYLRNIVWGLSLKYHMGFILEISCAVYHMMGFIFEKSYGIYIWKKTTICGFSLKDHMVFIFEIPYGVYLLYIIWVLC